MDLVDLNLHIPLCGKCRFVEILMDLVDLNAMMKILRRLLMVEILMDLVDLNLQSQCFTKEQTSRDPYGSRGSKLIQVV